MLSRSIQVALFGLLFELAVSTRTASVSAETGTVDKSRVSDLKEEPSRDPETDRQKREATTKALNGQDQSDPVAIRVRKVSHEDEPSKLRTEAGEALPRNKTTGNASAPRKFPDLFTQGYNAPVSKTLSQSEAIDAVRSRTCVKTFPWSEAEIAAIKHHGLPSSAQILARLKRTQRVLAEAAPADLTPEETKLRKDVEMHGAGTLLRYGEFLVALKLFQEHRFEDLLKRVDLMALSTTDEELEQGPDDWSTDTYYRDDELRKMLGALQIQAKVQLGKMTATDAVTVLERIPYLTPYASIVAPSGFELSKLSSALLTKAQETGAPVERIGSREYLVARGKSRLIVGMRAKSSDAWQLLPPERAATELQDALDRVVRTRSTHASEVWALVPVGDGMRLVRPGQAIDIARTSQYSGAVPFKEARATGHSAAVLYVPEFVREQGRALARRLIVDAQREDPEAQLFLDDPRPTAVLSAEAATKLQVGGLVTAIVPRDPGVIDGKVIQNFQDDLKQAHIKYVVFAAGDKLDFPRGGAVIVISGHSAPELWAYVRDLAAAKAFRENHVVFAACGTELTEAMRDEIIAAGAASVMGFDETITTTHVEELLDGLVKERRDRPQRGLVNYTIELLRRLNLPAVWQVSERITAVNARST